MHCCRINIDDLLINDLLNAPSKTNYSVFKCFPTSKQVVEMILSGEEKKSSAVDFDFKGAAGKYLLSYNEKLLIFSRFFSHHKQDMFHVIITYFVTYY